MLTKAELDKIESTSIVPVELLDAYLADKITERPFYGDDRHEVAAEKKFQDMRADYMRRIKATQDESNKAAKRSNGLK